MLNIKGISKSYGNIKAVENLSLEINQGEVYGILGPNGSGKTTTLGIVLDVLVPDQGSYTWFGKVPNKDSRKKIGSILETPNFYPYLTAYQSLSLACKIKEVNESEIDRVLNIVDLTSRAHSKFKTFSLGMKQRLSLASALLGNPQVLVLDEPTNGLDPQGIAEVRSIIQEVAKEGKTIIMASHILDEVEKICSHVAILKQGRLLAHGEMKSVLNNEEQVLVGSDDMEKLMEAINQINGVSNIKHLEGKILLTLPSNMSNADLNHYLNERGVSISEMGTKKSGLEENFLDLIK